MQLTAGIDLLDDLETSLSPGISNITTILLKVSRPFVKQDWRSLIEQLPQLRNLEIDVDAAAYQRNLYHNPKKSLSSADIGLEIHCSLVLRRRRET